MGAAGACAAFSAAGDAVVAPPSDAGVRDAATVSDDATSACIPEAIEIADAGEDARCGTQGETVNLGSTEHCGFCGHDCRDGACVDGVCEGVKVVAELGNMVSVGTGTSALLYYSSSPEGCTGGGRIRRIALDGPEPETLYATDGGCVWPPTVRGEHLFVYHSTRGILRVPLAAPSDAGVIARGSIAFIAVSSSTVFWSTGDSVAMSELDGSNVVPAFSGARVAALAADAERGYWIVHGETGASTLYWRERGGGTTYERPLESASVAALALDAEWIYVGSPDGTVHRVAKPGSGPLELVTRIAAPDPFPRAMAVAGDFLYVAAGEDTSNGWFDLYRATKCGGRARRVARDYMFPNGLAPAGRDHLYFGRIGALARIAR
jgi:hypothetical protein